MEAVGAAGAIIGLAGSALAGLKSLGEFIAILQDGKIDLDTTQRRLVEHEFRLSELRNEYDSLPNGSITSEEKELLDDCIKGSHEEVKSYKKLLDKAAKTRTQRKNFQKAETALRMYLHGKDFKKHRSLLLDRTMRLQEFNERSNRIRVGESFQSIISSAANHHSDNMKKHAKTANALQAVSKNLEKSMQQCLGASSSLEARMTAIVGNYNEQTQSFIQSSQLSTVQELNQSMSQSILPMIQRILDESQRNDQSLLRGDRREVKFQHQTANELYDNDYGISHKAVSVMCHHTFQTVYWTPFGHLRVSDSRKSVGLETCDLNRMGTAYWIRFDPYRCFSKRFVEWKIFLNTANTGPPTSIWCNIGVLCEDSEVVDALGLIRGSYQCSHEKTASGCCMSHRQDCMFGKWQTKLPDCRKLKRLLDGRHFSQHDYLGDVWGRTGKILTIFVRAHEFCEQPRRPILYPDVVATGRYCFSEGHHLIVEGHSDLIRGVTTNFVSDKATEDFGYMSQFYPAYYETLKMLLEIGCGPDNDDWNDLLSEITDKTFHVMKWHMQYASTDYFRMYSAMKLVQEAATCSTATDCYLPGAFRCSPISMNAWVGHAIHLVAMPGIRSHTGNLLLHKTLFHELKETIFDIGGPDALNEGLQHDRWLLVLMSYMYPELRSLLAIIDSSRRDARTYDFSIERVRREIESASRKAKYQVADYLVLHGDLKLLQFLIQKGFKPSFLLSAAARRGDPEILDFILEQCLKEERALKWSSFVHHHCMRARIAHDSAFRARLLNALDFPARQASQQLQKFDQFLINPHGDGFLGFNMNIPQLLRAMPAETPKYISELTDSCLTRYDREQYRFPGGIRRYLLCGLYVQHSHFDYVGVDPIKQNHTECEDLGRPVRAFHEILQQLVSSSAFGCGLEEAPNVQPYDQEPGTENYTPLMLALYGGMVPAVQILVKSGAKIMSCNPSGRSALQLAEDNAQGDHPRVCWGGIDKSRYERRYRQYVSMSADTEMLQILRDALCGQTEEAPDPSLFEQEFTKPKPPLVLKIFGKTLEQIEVFSYWLFNPNVYISVENLDGQLSYIAVVFITACLSIVQLMRLHFNSDVAKGIMKFLCRPIVLVPITIWIIRASWRQYFAGPETSGGLP